MVSFSFVQIDEEEAGGSGVKKERYFWQYNVQAKGPKGQVTQIKILNKVGGFFLAEALP